MILRRKHVPEQFQAMWASGIVNLSLSIFCFIMYYLNGNLGTLISAIVMSITFIVMFVLLNKFTKKLLWKRLSG